MKSNEIIPVNWEHVHIVGNDVKFIEYNPSVRVRAADYTSKIPLAEASVKEIKSLFDDDFLRQKERASNLEGFRKFGFKGNTITYYVPSAKNRIPGHPMQGKGYHVKIQFVNWVDLVSDADLNASEAAWMAFWASDIRLSCTCPSFLYYGLNYLCTAIDAAIYPEIRKPVKMNPAERGIVCKHLRRVLDYLGPNLTDISTEIRNFRNLPMNLRNQELDNIRRQEEKIRGGR